MQQREKRQGLLPAAAAWGSGFQLAKAIGQQPKGAIEADTVVDALHWARGLAATVRGAGGKAAFDEVFLRAVEHAPQVAAAVVVTARHQDL
jgi:hypothetical protein